MTGHQVMRFADGLSQKLATRSRHLCVFLGAGISCACGLPDVARLETQIRSDLLPSHRTAFEVQLAAGHNLEGALSRLRRIDALLGSGTQQLDGLTGAEAADLDREICRRTVAALDISQADLTPVLRFATWAGRADYGLPLEVFTINYDLLLETGLEALGVPYFDGFVGAMRARFRTELVEAAAGGTDDWMPSFLVRLWKLHGSVNWAWTSRGAGTEVVRLGSPVSDDSPAAIYPSDAKYDESRRVPFVVLQDRLRRALYESETLTLISGYSFGDEHLNEILFDAARRRPRSEMIAFCFSAIPDGLADRALEIYNLQVVASHEAIIGGVRADWEAPEEPLENLWKEGFALHDFANLAAFLARSSPTQSETPFGSVNALANPGQT